MQVFKIESHADHLPSMDTGLGPMSAEDDHHLARQIPADGRRHCCRRLLQMPYVHCRLSSTASVKTCAQRGHAPWTCQAVMTQFRWEQTGSIPEHLRQDPFTRHDHVAQHEPPHQEHPRRRIQHQGRRGGGPPVQAACRAADEVAPIEKHVRQRHEQVACRAPKPSVQP